MAAWLLGIPQRILNSITTKIREQRILRSSASGMYDENTIRSAVQNYVFPKYASVDPAEYQEPAIALLDARADLFSAMDSFIERKSADGKFLLVLADSGMGKTSFLINYFHRSMSWRRARKHTMFLVSLSSPEALEQISSYPKDKVHTSNLLLDAFDEDTKAIGRTQERLKEIIDTASSFRTITISCRTQFFLSEENVPSKTGVSRIGAVPLKESKDHRFAKVYLSPFDDDQVDEFLKIRYPGLTGYRSRKRAKGVVEKVPSLSVRPMLLTHIPELIRGAKSITNAVDVYDDMVYAWAARESKWVASHELIRISKSLALDFFLHREERGGEFASPAEIVRLARSMGIKEIEENITARSLLNRNAAGMYKFAHRSIMEYFLADWILNEGGQSGLEITDQMAKFIAQRLDCSSDNVETFLTSCGIRVESEAPGLVLGHPMNFDLFRSLPYSVDANLLLNINTWSSSNRRMNLEERLFSFALASQHAGRARLSRVRIVFEPNDKGDQLIASAMVWFGALAVCGSFSVQKQAIQFVFGSDYLFLSEFALSGMSDLSVGSLRELTWKVEKRSFCVSTEAERVGDLSDLYRNPSVSFEFARDSNKLLIRMIQGTWDLRGPLSAYGVLSAEDVLEFVDGDYWLVKPITMKRSINQLRGLQALS